MLRETLSYVNCCTRGMC